ncbi:gliding motility-associated C-terminal domain-containing protein [Hymenobacter lutimineralis]|uniref:Gliding motility-associated C-terminal domain-containing protein n=1 Tax=Hymenobacter lutimineralis TaxID=2606448 RepID=A0A5D6V5V8_9BACT|nr:gliding motility-associated C-terminal domain-containing protein [Hymenobacter lutimineralis]TYZ10565.1 gliding motility-associated C-terminal domain-containing protein [Hymenobacter lutimineralis]
MRLRAFFLLVLLLSLVSTRGVAQCQNTPNSGACFKVYDAATRQEVTALCAGQRFRLRDCSGRPLDPEKVYYQLGTATLCTGFQPGDTLTTRTAPATAGQLVITQNTNSSAGTGIIFSRTFTVYATPAPTFTVQACAPGTVQVALTDRTYDRFTVQIGADPAQNVAAGTTANYPVPAGSSSVTVRGSYAVTGLCMGTATQPLPTLPAPVAPQLTSLTGLNAGVQFTFAGLQNQYQYVLEVADAAQPGGFRQVAKVPASTTTYVAPSAPASGCFRLRLTDACASVGAKYVSATGCAVQLAASAAAGRNELRWTTGGAPASFQISRNGQLITQLNGSATNYVDADVLCGSDYTYRVVAITGAVTATSNEVSVRAVTGSPPPKPTLTASFDLRNRVVLTASPSPAGSQATFRREQNTTTVELGTAPATLRDSTLALSTEQPACYTALLRDACGQTSAPSAAACPVILTALEQEAAGQYAVALRWTALDGGRTGARYQLLLLASDGQVLRSQPVNGLEVLDLAPPADRQVLRYRVEATTSAGVVSYSNVVQIVRRVRVTVPTAFTPNGDGLNDVLEVKGQFLTKYLFILRDRNGQEVFRGTSRQDKWDGRIRGAAPVPGVYVYRFETTDETGQPVVQNGSVTLLR